MIEITVVKISNAFNFKYTEEEESFSRLLLTYKFLKTAYVTFAPDNMEKKLSPPFNQGKLIFVWMFSSLNSRNLQFLNTVK